MAGAGTIVSCGWRRGALALALLLPATARAAEPVASPAIPDAELAARLDFLERRLDAARPASLAWQWGWTGFYSASLAANAGYAAVADDHDDRVRAIVDAVKSGVAMVQTLRLARDPLPGNLGAEPMRATPGEDRAARLQRLAVGERQLLASAERAETRYDLRRHLLVVGGNLLGGAAILAFGSARDAITSTAIGTAIGEAQIWSQPWRAQRDLADYRLAFPDASGTGWELRPRGPGVELVLRF